MVLRIKKYGDTAMKAEVGNATYSIAKERGEWTISPIRLGLVSQPIASAASLDEAKEFLYRKHGGTGVANWQIA